MGQWANPLKLHELYFLFLSSLYVVGVLWPGIKVWGSGRRPAAACSPTKQIACCCADWGLLQTKHEKCGFPGPRARVVGSALPDWPREKGTAQSAGQGHWSDEKIILPPTAAGPHAASNHLWAVTQPDWAERIWVGNFKTCSCFCDRERICITHSDLMDFPMFTLDSPFLLTCSNNESLMCRIPFPPLLLSPVSSCRLGMLCGPFHRLSQAYGEPLTRWLPGTRVSGPISHRVMVCLFSANCQEQHHPLSDVEMLTTNLVQLLL